ncbi:hypothetical protein BDQ17DRAFT_1332268 [Cyathus striatus]|nr:hypothetical protein BDQ17DRAFT_1332268 [Cyathus striatus]
MSTSSAVSQASLRSSVLSPESLVDWGQEQEEPLDDIIEEVSTEPSLLTTRPGSDLLRSLTPTPIPASRLATQDETTPQGSGNYKRVYIDASGFRTCSVALRSPMCEKEFKGPFGCKG